jgi:steroid delta-isomerase-like uncharacterized protein
MTTQQNEALVRRLYTDVLEAGDLGALNDLARADYVEHNPLPGQGTGRDGLRDRVSMLRQGVDQTFTLEDVIACDSKVVVRWTSHGTHVGEFLGIPPTGRSFSIAGIDIYRVEEGRLAEHWHVIDQLGMLQQLGILPAPEGAST